ncbi:hypothetical protein OIE67_05155 [Nonomuraea fuscirosea]|uniref:hypothetical protein n=1 Tax=Nonomuraea fuscirosea TaxID=1291556 RepID=UPI002DD7B6C0|nr:hypothetical protein [Nonomuraea fuscirosea]WSA54026.1 hypothetical protein OIE67_05155 [Nonomuraea fuscirosea]
MIRIAVIDDHELIRHGLEYLLHRSDDLKVVLQGADLGALRGSHLDHDVLVLDLGRPGRTRRGRRAHGRRRRRDDAGRGHPCHGTGTAPSGRPPRLRVIRRRVSAR